MLVYILICIALLVFLAFFFILQKKISADTQSDKHNKSCATQKARKSEQLPERDNWESDYLVGEENEIPVEIESFIHYRDGLGQESRRKIRTRSLTPWGDDHAILAFCHARNAHRTFLVSRVTEFVDLSSGEVVDNIENYLRAIYRKSPQGRLDKALTNLATEILILLFIGRSDGRLNLKERESIQKYLEETTTKPINAQMLKKTLSNYRPTTNQFRAALKDARTELSESRRQSLVIAVEHLAGARTKTDELTAAAIAMTQKQLIVNS